MTTEKERFEVLLEDMESKFNIVIETLTSLRDDFRSLRDMLAGHEERFTEHELRITALEHAK